MTDKIQDSIEFYNNMSFSERLLFRRVCKLENKRRRSLRKLRNKIEGLEELLEEVENTKE